MSFAFLVLILLTIRTLSVEAQAQFPPQPQTPPAAVPGIDAKTARAQQQREEATETPDWRTQVVEATHALKRLPLAAALACVLALRPRRRGTPKRQTSVVQTQIILSVVGAVVMLVVGSSLARAFGIVGAAGLVRYRAKINDPKDAGVLLSTLAVGLAAGVGLWLIALFATAFILAVLWVVESFEPRAMATFLLTIKAKNPAALKPKAEQLFVRHRIQFEIRTESPEELSYEVELPLDRKTDRLSNVIMKLDPDSETAVQWAEKKAKP